MFFNYSKELVMYSNPVSYRIQLLHRTLSKLYAGLSISPRPRVLKQKHTSLRNCEVGAGYLQ